MSKPVFETNSLEELDRQMEQDREELDRLLQASRIAEMRESAASSLQQVCADLRQGLVALRQRGLNCCDA